MRQKIYNLFNQLDSDNPLEVAREIVAPLCMDKMNNMIMQCNDCKTASGDRKISYGNPNANYMIINDVASNDDGINEYLNVLIDAAGIDINDVFFVNSVSCVCQRKVKDEYIERLPSIEEAKNCKFFLNHAIQFVRPRVIIAMGATALTMYKDNYTLQEAKGSFLDFNGIKTIISYSIKDLFDFSSYKTEEEVQETADEILGILISAKEYIDSIRSE